MELETSSLNKSVYWFLYDRDFHHERVEDLSPFYEP